MKKFWITLAVTFLTIQVVKAETLNFNNILEKAIKNSYELNIAKTSVDISEMGIKEMRADYFPQLSASFYNSYDRNLDDTGSGINSVGDTVLLGSTRYQNALALALQYNLFDFGVRDKKMLIAKKDKSQKEVEYNKELRNLKIELADLYVKALLANKELGITYELLDLNKKIFAMHEALNEAGTIRKTEVTDQALKVARLMNRVDDLKTELNNALEDISLKTGEEYDVDELIILKFKSQPDNIEYVSDKKPGGNVIQLEAVESEFIDESKLPEYKSYELEIEKKKAELSILKRNNLPHFKFYSSYYFYGSNNNNFFDTFDDFEHRNLSFKIASTLPIFDGFKNKALREKAKLEIKKLEMEREKVVERVKTYYEKLYEESHDFSVKLSNQERSLELVKEKLAMVERLYEQRLIDKISYLTQKSDLINQKFELEKAIVNNEAATYKLAVLNNAYYKLPAPESQELDAVYIDLSENKIPGRVNKLGVEKCKQD